MEIDLKLRFYMPFLILGTSLIAVFLIVSERFDLFAILTPFPLLLYFVFRKTEYAISLIILSIFLTPYLIGLGILPRGAKWITEITIFLLCIKVFFLKASGKKLNLPLGTFVFLTLSILAITSLFLNNTNFLTILLGIRLHFKYLFLFYVLLNLNLNMDFYKKVIHFLLIIAIIQIPVTIVQVLTYNSLFSLVPQVASLTFIDIAGGTFGWGDTTGILAIFLGAVICFLVGYQAVHRFNLKHSLITIALTIPIFLSQSMASLIIIPIALLMLLLLGGIKSRFFLVSSLILVGLLGMISNMLLSPDTFGSRTMRYFSNPKKTIEQQAATDVYGRPKSAGKIAAITYTTKLVGKKLSTLAFGFGLGSSSESYFTSFRGRLSQEFRADVGYELKPQIARIITDMGILGLFLYLIFFTSIYNVNKRIFHTTTDKYWKSISLGFKGMIFLYLMGLFYRPILDAEPTGFSFWFISTAVFSLSNRIHMSRVENQTVIRPA